MHGNVYIISIVMIYYDCPYGLHDIFCSVAWIVPVPSCNFS